MANGTTPLEPPASEPPRTSGTYVRPLLAVVLTLGIFGELVLLMFHPVPEENHDLVVYMLGTLTGVAGSAATYYFGSSSGSEVKSALLAKK